MKTKVMRIGEWKFYLCVYDMIGPHRIWLKLIKWNWKHPDPNMPMSA